MMLIREPSVPLIPAGISIATRAAFLTLSDLPVDARQYEMSANTRSRST
jgi:hypothetical protein